MKKVLLPLLFIVIISCQRKSNIVTEDTNEDLFKPMVMEEIDYISRNIEGLKNDKGKEWYKSDSIFYNLWMQGAKEELDGNFKKAMEFYTKAKNIKRYEISTYEVKLSLGRTYMQLNEKEKAKQLLTEFRKEAKKELSGEEVEWGLTDEAKESLTRNIEDCDYLLGMLEQK